MSDETIQATIEIFPGDDAWWLLVTGELDGPHKTQDAAIDAIPAMIRRLP